VTERITVDEPTDEDVAAIVALLFQPKLAAAVSTARSSGWTRAARQEMTGRWKLGRTLRFDEMDEE
jgi:hypothetical protein